MEEQVLNNQPETEESTEVEMSESNTPNAQDESSQEDTSTVDNGVDAVDAEEAEGDTTSVEGKRDEAEAVAEPVDEPVAEDSAEDVPSDGGVSDDEASSDEPSSGKTMQVQDGDVKEGDASEEEPSAEETLAQTIARLESELATARAAVVTGLEEALAEAQAEAASTKEALETANAEAATAKKQAEDHLDKMQRTAAEFQNSKRRQERQLTEQIERASTHIVKRILPVLDDLDLAFQNTPAEVPEEIEAWLGGFSQIQKKLMSMLEDQEVEAIAPEGEFDPLLHEAISSEPNEEVESGHIIQTLRAGYTHKGRVLRAALVRVAM
ncbi:MAG: nucleotide exchange factor GrpE [Chloroflexota bacterium]